MKTKRETPNAQRPMPNLEWSRDGIRTNESSNTEDRLLDFAVNVVELTESLPSTRAGNHIAGQLLRCGTSPLSNHGEVEAAEYRKDFLHKLRICLKELRETKRWLRLVSGLKKLGQAENLTFCLNEVNQHQNFRQRSNHGNKREMMPRSSALGVGRWALGVGR